MGNSGNCDFISDLKRLAADPDPVVAQHARWALEKLSAAVALQSKKSSQ
jgi:hypothetical protein